MAFLVDDLVGWVSVSLTETGMALSGADENQKAAARAGLAAGLAITANSAAAGALVTAATSTTDAVLTEAGVDPKIRKAVSTAGSAAETVTTGQARADAWAHGAAQVIASGTGQTLEEAGVDGGGAVAMLANGASTNGSELGAKAAGGAVGVGAAAAVHAARGDDAEVLLDTLGAGYSAGTSMGASASGALRDATGTPATHRNAWMNGASLMGETAGLGIALAVHARANEVSHGASDFREALSAGRGLGRAAARVPTSLAREAPEAGAPRDTADDTTKDGRSWRARMETHGQTQVGTEATKQNIQEIRRLVTALGRLVVQTEVKPKADDAGRSTDPAHRHEAESRSEDVRRLRDLFNRLTA